MLTSFLPSSENSMQTYAFHELTERAQDAAYIRYSQIIDEAVEGLKSLFPNDDPFVFLSVELSSMGWRFNEHGERIA